MPNAVLESIHQVLGNLVQTLNISTQTYIDEDDPGTGILDSAEFVIFSTTNAKKVYSPVQLILVYGMVLPIERRVDWELIHQKRQTQSNKDNTQENNHRVEYDYRVRYKFMLTNHT